MRERWPDGARCLIQRRNAGNANRARHAPTLAAPTSGEDARRGSTALEGKTRGARGCARAVRATTSALAAPLLASPRQRGRSGRLPLGLPRLAVLKSTRSRLGADSWWTLGSICGRFGRGVIGPTPRRSWVDLGSVGRPGADLGGRSGVRLGQLRVDVGGGSSWRIDAVDRLGPIRARCPKPGPNGSPCCQGGLPAGGGHLLQQVPMARDPLLRVHPSGVEDILVHRARPVADPLPHAAPRARRGHCVGLVVFGRALTRAGRLVCASGGRHYVFGDSGTTLSRRGR